MLMKTLAQWTLTVSLLKLSAGIIFGFSLEPTGLAKPLADLRDYNGTYYGSPDTGTIGYTGGTLYRDNQDNGAVSGCRGEGCGQHSGVDIPVPSGTNVYNSIEGVVVMSECNGSWGGLIVVRATNPWNYSEQIYLTYAHLKSRRYSNGQLVLPGDYVSTGAKIGISGGSSRDSCAGRSTGPHLHFQIDLDDGNAYPWYPHVSALNVRDDKYAVTAKTYNPIVFLTGGYRWTFARRNDRELWNLFNFQSWGVSGSALWTDSGPDPYISRGGLSNCGFGAPCSSNITAEAKEYSSVFLDTYNQCTSGIGKVYFTTNEDSYWSESKSVRYYPWYGEFADHIYMQSNPNWRGIVTGLRIDPAENCNRYIWDPTYYGEITIER